jgi:hypothetical protein
MIPESVLNEDEQLQMIYDTAVTRTGNERIQAGGSTV